jgi:hypothetical protein
MRSALAGLIVVLALAGCSAAGSHSSSKAAAPAEARGAAAGAADNNQAQKDNGVPTQNKDGAVAQAPAGLPYQVPTDRSVIYNGTMTVRVPDVDAAAAQVTALATGKGGFVGGDQRSLNGSKSTATVTVRIPVDQFSPTVDAIGSALSRLGGKEESRQITAEDVTAKMVDLNSRMKTQQASVDRIRALLGQAKSLTDITTLESELSSRESDLESLEAQVRDLTNLSTLSSLTVTLLEPDAAAAAKPKKAEGGFLGGLKSGWHAFAASLRAVLTVLGAVLPFLVLIGLPAWIVWYVIRRRRPTRATTAPEPAPVATSDGT